MITCKHCKAQKPEGEMKLRAGMPSKVCLECDGKAAAERVRIRQVVEQAKAETHRGRGKGKRKQSSRAVATPPSSSSNSRFLPAASA